MNFNQGPAQPLPDIKEEKPVEKMKIVGFADQKLKIMLELEGKNPQKPEERKVVAYFSGLSNDELTGINMQIAVLKHMKATLNAATDTTIKGIAENAIRQEFTVINSMAGVKPMALKIRIAYNCNGQPMTGTQSATFPLTA